MSFYVDASTVVALIARQSASAHVDPFLMGQYGRVLISDFAQAECSAALARLGRVERWSRPLADTVFATLDEWVARVPDMVEIAPGDINAADHWIRRPGIALRAPDAIHIAASHRLEATLVTLDLGMVRAATALGLTCINPAETLGDTKD